MLGGEILGQSIYVLSMRRLLPALMKSVKADLSSISILLISNSHRTEYNLPKCSIEKYPAHLACHPQNVGNVEGDSINKIGSTQKVD